MQTHTVTTPFGRRPMTLALVKGQIEATDIQSGKSADKWKVFRDACEARTLLGIADRTLSVLNALLSFYPDQMLSEDRGLVVFPSNNQLSVRAHGMTGTTLRRHLAALVDAGLITRKDSPNGKRYAHKDRAGTIEEAFGFSLRPLLARSEILANLAQQVAIDRRTFRMAREKLTICRRDIRKLISAAIEEGAAGHWSEIESDFVRLLARIPRSPSLPDITSIAEEMEMFRSEIVNLLESQIISQKTDSNADQFGRHIQNSNTESIHELEPSFEEKQGESPVHTTSSGKEGSKGRSVDDLSIKAFPLGMVLRACTEIAMFGPGGAISNWRDLMSAAVVARSQLGVSPSAYQEACDIMGPENAAVAIACILERGGHINSAGGYLRDLTRRAANGEFSLGPMLMALLRANGTHQERAG